MRTRRYRACLLAVSRGLGQNGGRYSKINDSSRAARRATLVWIFYYWVTGAQVWIPTVHLPVTLGAPFHATRTSGRPYEWHWIQLSLAAFIGDLHARVQTSIESTHEGHSSIHTEMGY